MSVKRVWIVTGTTMTVVIVSTCMQKKKKVLLPWWIAPLMKRNTSGHLQKAKCRISYLIPNLGFPYRL